MESLDKMKMRNPDIRYLYDLKDVLYDQEWLKQSPNLELYYMYRAIKKENNIRYDKTVIPAQKLGREFTKTKGHSHPDKFGELYFVVSGKCFCLIQKTNSQEEVEDVYAVEAIKNQYIVIPPGYSHITINHGEETLEMTNWVSDEFHADYSLIEEKKGASYYYLTDFQWLKNNNYKKVPELKFKKALDSKPEDLSFLG